MASIWSLQFHSLSFLLSIWGNKHWLSSNVVRLPTKLLLNHSQLKNNRKVQLRAIAGSSGSEVEQPTQNAVVNSVERGLVLNSEHPFSRFQGTISSFPPVVLMMKKYGGSNLVIGFCIATAILIIAVRAYVVGKSRDNIHGSVADLVRRGHLRSDRRGISSPLKYDDPFNNPLVKVGKGNSTVEMCGKVYRLAPVTLTRDQQAIHQKRRSRAYQWKRPTIFLKEGDSIPPDVDPDTIRWIPANHPFATTTSEIDEDLAQNNVYQKHGVPFRIQAEHEALQRKLEALQNDEKLNNLMIDGRNAKDFQRPFKLYSKSNDPVEESPNNSKVVYSKPPRPKLDPNSSQGNLSSEEMQKP
ncbi:hypothetical protein SLEP1_g11222 [Rubroshorea leprosula]|uniref:Protein MULTIPLE CHLOROPLAST DIVISION SITE 1 n=1 Tax=Rubroshorea leprosula TaxID=152421 RepID=A0AAV5IJV9_9ROSI|nr:hypothetical protein SLEP1_g11222 [Rubroshorea leprosula]